MTSLVYRRFGGELATILSVVLLVNFATLWFLPLMTRGLGADAYGTWAQVQVTLTLGIGVVGFGLPYAMTRILSATQDRSTVVDDFWSAVALVGAVVGLVALVFLSMSEVVARVLFAGQVSVVRLTAVLLVTWALDHVCLSFLRARREIRIYAILTVAHSYVSLGVIAALALRGGGILSALVALLAVQSALLVGLLIAIIRRLGVARPRFRRIREYLAFGVPTIPGNISSWIVHASDRYVIGYFLGMSAVGVYAAAFTVGTVCTFLGGVLGFVSPAALSQLYDQGRIAEVRTILSGSLKYALAIAVPFVFGVIALGQPVLQLLTTQEMASQAGIIPTLISVSVVMEVAQLPFGMPLFLARKTPVTATIWTAAAVLNLVLNLSLVPRIGILGAAVGTVIAQSLGLVCVLVIGRKILRVSMQWSFFAKTLVASAVMWLVTSLLPAEGPATVAGAVSMGVFVYVLGMVLMRAVTMDEIRMIRSIFWQPRTHSE